MVGGSPRHAALSARVARALGAALGRECEVFSGDLQLGVAEHGRYVYADATVACGPLLVQAGTKDVVENPSIVVEVLSPSSEQYDRGLKWDGYRRLSSLTDIFWSRKRLPVSSIIGGNLMALGATAPQGGERRVRDLLGGYRWPRR